MGYLRKLKLSFLSVVFLIFIPLVILISSTMAILNYKDLYNHILNQINNKLLSISSVTAAFIDGDDYKVVQTPRKISSFTYDKKTNTLYGVSDKNELCTIDQKLGAAKVIEDISLDGYELVDLSSGIDNTLYAITKSNKLIKIDLASKKIKELKAFNIPLDGLAYESMSNSFYISSGTKLYKYEKDIKLLKEFDTKLYSLDITADKLYGVDRQKDKIFEIDLEELSLNYFDIEDYPNETTGIYALALSGKKFYMGQSHLVVFDKKEKTLDEENFARLYRDESSPLYKKYIEPMTQIKSALNLTYHYTFNLLYGDDNHNCYYIFDVSEGNEYTPIGSYDIMDEKDLAGAEDVMYRDKAYVGSVKLWEKWGLLKVAYAGIKDSDGKVVAIAGTDVDITFIKSKTHEALVHSITIGIITLILSIIASYYIAIKILKPIEKLKTSALKIAAGNYKEKVHIHSPIELAELSTGFNHMSEQLTSEIKNFKNYSMEIKQRKINEKLHKKLFYLNSFRDSKIQVSGLEKSLRACGVILYEHKYYAWCSKDSFKTKIEASKYSAVMSDVLQKILKFEEKLLIFNEIYQLESFVVIDVNSSKITDILSDSFLELESINNNEINVGDMKIHISPQYT